MDDETLSYKERPSKKNECRHCVRFSNVHQSEHRCFFDPNLQKWVDICLNCEMVDLSEDQ